jgi:O-methyltransferase
MNSFRQLSTLLLKIEVTRSDEGVTIATAGASRWSGEMHRNLLKSKLVLKRLLSPLIYRYPPIMIQPERLYLWFKALIETNGLEGDVVEVGCYLGGTAAFSKRLIDRLGMTRNYIVIDTFGGFTKEQWAIEESLGTSVTRKDHFADNSPALARWVLDRHGGKTVRIVQGDITSLPDRLLPDRISACLLDVDLSEPIEKGLERLYPRLEPGGVILVDDCGGPTYQPRSGYYEARLGYAKFCQAHSLSERYEYGMGIVTRDQNWPVRTEHSTSTLAQP